MKKTYPIAGCILAFIVLTVLVHVRVLAGVDLVVTERMPAVASPLLDALGGTLSILFSFELSVIFGLIATLWFWRKGYGLRSVAPLIFLVLVGLEFLMKRTVHQPLVPAEFQHTLFYPLATVSLDGSFPSGHSLRAAFSCTFAFATLRSRTWSGPLLFTWLMPVIAVLTLFTRVYLGDHWLSDVVAGALLGIAGAALASWLLVSPPRAPDVSFADSTGSRSTPPSRESRRTP